MSFIDLMILFIVVYLLVMIGRWFVLPHLKVFPNIPPQFLWTTGVKVVLYAMNAIFHYILMALLIIYILWIIIKRFFPNFPIPLRMIFLRLPPFRPLERAGVLPLIDRIVKTILSTAPLPDRLISAGTAFATFVAKSVAFVFKTVGINPPADRYVGESDPKPVSESPFNADEEREIRESYLQCVEESTISTTPDMTPSQRQQADVKNTTNTTLCKVKMLSTYSDILSQRMKR